MYCGWSLVCVWECKTEHTCRGDIGRVSVITHSYFHYNIIQIFQILQTFIFFVQSQYFWKFTVFEQCIFGAKGRCRHRWHSSVRKQRDASAWGNDTVLTHIFTYSYRISDFNNRVSFYSLMFKTALSKGVKYPDLLLQKNNSCTVGAISSWSQLIIKAVLNFSTKIVGNLWAFPI